MGTSLWARDSGPADEEPSERAMLGRSNHECSLGVPLATVGASSDAIHLTKDFVRLLAVSLKRLTDQDRRPIIRRILGRLRQR